MAYILKDIYCSKVFCNNIECPRNRLRLSHMEVAKTYEVRPYNNTEECMGYIPKGRH